MTTTETPPLSQPLYGATFGQACSRFLKKYSHISGYASRSEYWWAQLGLYLYALFTSFVLFGVLGRMLPPEAEDGLLVVMALSGLLVLLPQIAVSVRRLHDAGFSGLWFIVGCIPVFSIIFFVLTLMPTRVDKRREHWDDHTGD